MSNPTGRTSSRSDHDEDIRNPESFRGLEYAEQSVTTTAKESIARDLADEDVWNSIREDEAEPDVSRISTHCLTPEEHPLTRSHGTPSLTATGPSPFLGLPLPGPAVPIEQDRDSAIGEERALLRDNNLLRPKGPRRNASQASTTSSSRGLQRQFSIPRFSRKSNIVDEESGPATETTALLPHSEDASQPPHDAGSSPSDTQAIDKQWEEAILTNSLQTTWQRETKVLASYSGPLVLTFILQNSLTLTSIFTVGHIGKVELGAVSLGGMTANITGYAIYHGLATSLDTLCAQAYGSGNKKLVGLNLQRMVFFLWAVTVPIAVVWYFAADILTLLVPEKEIAVFAGRYLRVLILGAPGYACFESSKRYVQAQGRFAATLYVLLIAAPANVVMHWLFVWRFDWGFIGCPTAIVITESLMPLLLALYVRFIGGMECWPGLSRAAFRNWGPMVRLALPGFVMVMAEFLAFEILTLASANFSASHLAANTVLQSLSVLTYQLPFPLSIAGSTRVANLVGASLPEAAKVTARVMFVLGTIIGVFNMVMLSSLRHYIPHLFTREPDVIALAAQTLPINAAFQLFDSLAAQCNGVLRGLGKQSFGGVASLVAFYGIALPISFGTGFGLHWELYGLWAGPAIGLFVQASTEGWYIYRTSWAKASEEAARRNAAG
ncbi:hypothetical protein LTR37_012113 [Vermiconidia calcicola]|uniref:Uncharacterized protein n=1 Tax=Vermiconidia calcicola TaxID=1690605 RepID=A0ACC3N044_9PEZI|nr:hypothetical protein LTR37_012113 [Vermiconidia calcicola]